MPNQINNVIPAFCKGRSCGVCVTTTSVNTVDTMIRQMGKDLSLSHSLPAVLGMDFAGTIEDIGEGGTDFSPGNTFLFY